MGGETASSYYVDLLQPQMTNLDIVGPGDLEPSHQNKLQLSQLTDLDVVGVKDVELPCPVELEEDRLHQGVE